jgi:hypothetical protein
MHPIVAGLQNLQNSRNICYKERVAYSQTGGWLSDAASLTSEFYVRGERFGNREILKTLTS